jgi:hypothetical protein
MKRTAFFLATAFVLAIGSAFVTKSNAKFDTAVFYVNGSGACVGPETITDDCNTTSSTPCTFQGFNVYQNRSGSTCQNQLFKP